MMMTIEQAATYLGMTAEGVRYLARNRRIPAAKVGRAWRFHREDLEGFIRSQYGNETKVEKAEGINVEDHYHA